MLNFGRMSKEKNLIALDLNKDYISVLELSHAGEKKTVEFFNAVECPSGIFTGNTITGVDHLILLIEKLILNNKNKSKDTIFAIPEDLAIEQILSVDKTFTNYDIENFIIANFEKYISNLEMTEVYIDFHQLGESLKNPNKKDVLLVVAKKSDVDKIEDAIQSAGLNPVSIDLTSYSLARMIKFYKREKESEVLAYFDIKKDKTGIHFFKDAKRIFYQENEDFSLNYLNEEEDDSDKKSDTSVETIEHLESMTVDTSDDGINIDLTDDEDEKIDNNEVENNDVLEDLDSLDLINNIDENEKVANKKNQQFFDFIQDSLDIFYSVVDDVDKVDKIVLSGNIPSLNIDLDTLSSELGTKLISAQPFARMSISKNVNDEKLYKYAPNLGVLVGLAMPKESEDVKINLHDWRAELRLKKNKGFQTTLAFYLFGCVSILLAGHFSIDMKIDAQNARNLGLQSEIDIDNAMNLDIQIKKSEKDQMIERISIINNLQVQRPKIVHLFTDIAGSVPKDIYLSVLSRRDTGVITLNGIAGEDSKVFELIRNLERSKWFHNVKITNIKSFDGDNKEKSYSNSQYKFEIEMREEDMSKIIRDKESKDEQ